MRIPASPLVLLLIQGSLVSSFHITPIDRLKHVAIYCQSQRYANGVCSDDTIAPSAAKDRSLVVTRRGWLIEMATAAIASSTTTIAAAFLSGSPALASDGEASPLVSTRSDPSSSSSSSEGLTVYKTPSGLKYIDLEPGTGPTPSYGQLLSITYTGYVKLPASKDNPNPKPELFEKTSSPYLIKHGNGRTIAGLDEGLHTMQVGGKRRLLIPPKLGYTEIGLGPVPTYPWDRAKLNRLLQQMVELVGGTVIYEVRLLSAVDDEADQGYYQDESLSPEEFEQLRLNLQQQAKAAADEGVL